MTIEQEILQRNPPPGERLVPGVRPGAEQSTPSDPVIEVNSIEDRLQGGPKTKDLRVKILVPPSYFTSFTKGTPEKNQLEQVRGIIFPYTPQISFEAKADYSEQKPLHTNYAINFYQRSYVTDISITGEFTVENSEDAEVYLSTMHLLKALTKMRFGTDKDAGSAPPVCRLYAYGNMVLHSVPVAINSYRVELPKEVDYYHLVDSTSFDPNLVPVRSTIGISCKVMYSRQELQGFGVSNYLDGAFINKGFI